MNLWSVSLQKNQSRDLSADNSKPAMRRRFRGCFQQWAGLLPLLTGHRPCEFLWLWRHQCACHLLGRGPLHRALHIEGRIAKNRSSNIINISWEQTITPLSIKTPRELELGWNSEWRKIMKDNVNDLAPQGCISCSYECRAFPKASSADVTPGGPSQWKWSGLSATGGFPNAGWDRLNLAGSIQSFGVATWKKNWKNGRIEL